ELRDAEVRRERTRAEERIRHLAYYDALTDLPNRTLFQNRLEQAVANSLRARNPLSVLIMDLDGFKEINDTLGHLMGDAVLREIGRRLLAGLRESDTVSRLGGDEFAVLLPNVGRAGAELAARKLIAMVQEPLCIEGLNLDVHGSVGIVLLRAHDPVAEIRRRGARAVAASRARPHHARSLHPNGRADRRRSSAHVVGAGTHAAAVPRLAASRRRAHRRGEPVAAQPAGSRAARACPLAAQSARSARVAARARDYRERDHGRSAAI